MNRQLNVQLLADWICEANQSVAFTGAGISTESGIPDFRSPGGVWSKYQTVYYDEFMSNPEARLEYWRQKCEAHADMAAAKPNAGHRALANWEGQGRLEGVITQNIDGLHRAAGNSNVIELHGTAMEVACQDCGHAEPADGLVQQFNATQQVPMCPECESPRMKHATVSFGQMLPQHVFSAADELSRRCELFIAIGSSLVVTPAADLPRIAKREGARLVIINRDATPLDDLADLIIRETAGDYLRAVDERI